MRKSYSAQHVYEGYLKKWILPRWRSCRLEEVKAVKVEQWLRSRPLARGSKAKIRNIMSALYSHAIRWEWIRHNPIRAVRQSAKRSSVPTILLIEQIQSLLKHLQEPCCTAVLLDAATGLRVGELLGLKWEDVDFEKLEINVTRSVVKQRIGPCKTEASRKPIPLDAELAHALWKWKSETVYNQPHDWVFASPSHEWQTALLARLFVQSTPGASIKGSEHRWQGGMAYVAAYFRHTDERER
jgi:integrase